MTPFQSSTFIISREKLSRARSDQATEDHHYSWFCTKQNMKIGRENRKGKLKYLFLKYMFFCGYPEALKKQYYSGIAHEPLKALRTSLAWTGDVGCFPVPPIAEEP